jgi:hypothetical protein
VRVVEALRPDHAKITTLGEIRRSFANAHLADKAERLEVAAERQRVARPPPGGNFDPGYAC